MKQLIPVACSLLLSACVDRDTAAMLPAAAGDVPDPAAAVAPDGAFCAVDEETVFGCTAGSGRTVALCASAGLSQEDGALQYREGAPGEAPELVWPDNGAAPSRTFRSGTLMYSGGGGAYLRFDRDGQTWTVYTGVGSGWEQAGVLVEEAGETVRGLVCRDDADSGIGPALFERAGIPADGDDFEIPVEADAP